MLRAALILLGAVCLFAHYVGAIGRVPTLAAGGLMLACMLHFALFGFRKKAGPIEQNEPDHGLNLSARESSAEPATTADFEPAVAVAVKAAGDASPRKRAQWVGGASETREAAVPSGFGRVLGRNLGWNLRLSYRDAGGIESERNVTVHQLAAIGDDSAPALLHGWCHLRRALRTFYVDRIEELIDLDTGEVAKDPAAWLSEKIGSDREMAAELRSRAGAPGS